MLQGAQESCGGRPVCSPGAPVLLASALLTFPVHRRGMRARHSSQSFSLSRPGGKRRCVCVHQEDRGRGAQASRPRSHPPPKPAFQRKSHLRPRWWAQQVRRSPAALAPGPCHMEQGGVSRMARPRLPLTPPEYTHQGPRVSPTLLCTHRNPLGAKPAPGSWSLTQPW